MEQYNNYQNNSNETSNQYYDTAYHQTGYNNPYATPMYNSGAYEPKKSAGSKFWTIFICILLLVNLTFTTFIYINMPPKERTAETQLSEHRDLIRYSEKVANKNIKLSNLKFDEGDDSYSHITAKLKNESDVNLVDISLTFNCFDESGEYIGTESSYLEQLAANETFKFDEIVYDSEVYEIELKKMTAYYESDLE